MKVGIVYFTENGSSLCHKIETLLKNSDYRGEELEFYRRDKEVKLSQWTEEAFNTMDAVIFISATGIAVRTIAPFIKSKTKDPAVIVIDDMGNFVISLLSGHVGGANGLSQLIAQRIQATPVITTATDVSNKLAIDEWAVKNNLIIEDIKPAKDIAMDILKDKDVYLKSDVDIHIKSRGIIYVNNENFPKDCGINISYKNKNYFTKELKLIPKTVVLGVGCRRGKTKEEIEAVVTRVLKEEDINPKSLCGLASIDLKKDEEGLIAYSNSMGIEFTTFTSHELKAVEGDFPPSNFVSSVTGVDNVCQRAAVLLSDNGRVLREKVSYNGVTVAIALIDSKLEI